MVKIGAERGQENKWVCFRETCVEALLFQEITFFRYNISKFTTRRPMLGEKPISTRVAFYMEAYTKEPNQHGLAIADAFGNIVASFLVERVRGMEGALSDEELRPEEFIDAFGHHGVSLERIASQGPQYLDLLVQLGFIHTARD